jgi:hypothetical protein
MKRWATISAVLVALYIGSYVPLSLAGRYDRIPRGYIGMVYWRPLGLVSQERVAVEPSFNALGYFYYPLVVADWALVHRPYHRC